MQRQDAYETLNLSPPVTDEEIEQAYRSLTKEYHPDQGGNRNRWIRIREARDTLLESERTGQNRQQREDEQERTYRRESTAATVGNEETSDGETKTREYTRQRRTRRRTNEEESASSESADDGPEPDEEESEEPDVEYGPVATVLGWILAVPWLVVTGTIPLLRAGVDIVFEVTGFVDGLIPWWAETVAVFFVLLVAVEILSVGGSLSFIVTVVIVLLLPTGTAVFFGVGTVLLLVGGELLFAAMGIVLTVVAGTISLAR